MEFFEDFQVGQIIPLGSYRMEEAEMLEFARQYDPQPFHVDPAAARDSIYGQLIANGLHTLSVFSRIWVDALPKLRGQGSPGWDEVRWRKPVLAGDELTGEMEVVETKPSRSRPQLGRVTFRATMTNQRGETVMELRPMGLVQRREGGEANQPG